MVLVIATHNQILKNMVFKEKKPFKNKSLADWQEKERFQCLFEEAIKDIQQKEPPIQTLVKSNLTKKFGLDIENQFFGSTGSTGIISSIGSTRSLVLLELLLSSNLPKLPIQPNYFQF
jgi:hypothetical protein